MTQATDTQRFTSASAAQTAEIAASLAGRLRRGDVVLLSGELGSGKTVFVRGAATALGVGGRVTSPTFAIGNVYPAGDLEVAHLDLYRLDAIDVGDEAVLDDFLTPERIAFVEWPHGELAGDPRLTAIVELAHAGEDRREISVTWLDGGAGA